jgi:hypothetical protein
VTAARALMNAASQAASPELRLGLSRAIRAVGVDIGAGVGVVHKRIEFLTVMHARIGHVILPADGGDENVDEEDP